MSSSELKRRADQKPASKAAKSITFSTIIMIIGLILSKGSGFLRTVILSHKFEETYREAFTAAFLIPDFVFALLVGGSIQSAITPTLSKAIEQKTQKKAWKGVSIFITLMSLFVLTFVVRSFRISFIASLIREMEKRSFVLPVIWHELYIRRSSL